MERNGKADQAGPADLLYRSFIEALAYYLFGRFDEPLVSFKQRVEHTQVEIFFQRLEDARRHAQ